MQGAEMTQFEDEVLELLKEILALLKKAQNEQ